MLLLTVFHHLFEEEIDFAAVVIVNIVIVGIGFSDLGIQELESNPGPANIHT